MKIIGIIPARYQSTRLLGKPLIQINGKPLIQLTYEAVLSSQLFDNIFIATDSEKIYELTSSFEAECIITSKKCQNGTERCAELITTMEDHIDDKDIIINIQCDEPFIQKKHLINVIDLIKSDNKIGTLVSDLEEEEVNDKSVVKTCFNNNKIAKKFSRDKSNFIDTTTLYKHVGIYGYTKHTLLNIANLKPTKQELKESLEQLRWMEYNYKITCSIIQENITSINTITDLKKVIQKNK